MILYIYIGYLIILSIITLLFFKKDKNMAVNNSNNVRIKERTLLGLCALGGAAGGFLGRILFRHKTKKLYFSVVIYASIILEVVSLVLMIYEVI